MSPVSTDHVLENGSPADVGRRTTEDLIEWYWAHGVARQGAYAISPVWLSNVYDRRDLLRSIELGRAQEKVSLGLWGPSQSGKSTLISQFVDQGADENGKGGCLDWGEPTLFSHPEGLPDNPEVVVFNPRNYGADASGCVSRFVLRDKAEVPFPDFPVELRFLNSAQLMHAISAGYLSECQRDDNWTVDRMEQALEAFAGNSEAARIDRRAFEYLHNVVDVIDLLIEARDERFTGLNAGGKWTSLSNRIVESKVLLSDQSKVESFAAGLLWGGQPTLTRLFERLVRTREKLPKVRLYCSMAVAAAMVNIESYRILQSKASDDSVLPAARRIKDVIKRLFWENRGPCAVIGSAVSGKKLLEEDEDFGLLQGLVRELIIPLRISQSHETGSTPSTFSRFMSKADLVDFPGVPARERNVEEKLIDLATLSDSDDSRLLTEVLKRGKVASLVNGYSRSLGLDAFMILARADRPIPKIEQLQRGLFAWWNFVDPKYDVYDSRGRKPPLPLFFNMTFFSSIVNEFAGSVSTGFYPLEERVKQLEPFAAPSACTMLMTTYPQFSIGKIPKESQQLALQAVESIRKDPSFGPRCSKPVTLKSLEQMATTSDGGVSYLFEVLADSLSATDRQRLLESRYRDALSDIHGLIEDHTPRDSNDRCRKDVEAVKAAVLTALNEKWHDTTIKDPTAWVSYRLRKLFDVAADDLDPIPRHGLLLQNYEEYVRNQLRKWIGKKSSSTGLAEIGLRDSALQTRLLEYLSDRVNVREVAKWIANELPSSRSREDSKELRRVLAIVLSNHLMHVQGEANAHPAIDRVIAIIRKWAQAEDSNEVISSALLKQSPHFTSVIQPIAQLLDHIAKGAQAARPEQSGDDEALALLGKMRSFFDSITR